MQVMRTETGCPGTGWSSWGSMPAADPGAAFLNRRGRRRPRLPFGGPLRPFRRPFGASGSAGVSASTGARGVRRDDLLGCAVSLVVGHLAQLT